MVKNGIKENEICVDGITYERFWVLTGLEKTIQKINYIVDNNILLKPNFTKAKINCKGEG